MTSPALIPVPTPRWAVPFERAGPEVRSFAAYGGRGSGKSRWAALRVIREQTADPASSTLCVRETQKSLNDSVKAELVTAIGMLGVQHLFEVQDARIRMRHGDGQIVFVGMQNHTAESVKSYSGYKRAWVEEAQSLSRTSLEVLTPTIRLPGSQIYYTWNPKHADDPVDEMFRCNSDAARERNQQPPASAVVVGVNFDQNPWFGEPLVTEMRECLARDIDAYNHIWKGEYEQASNARVFRNVKVRAFETPPNAIFYHGADFGFADATALVRCFIEGRTLYVDAEAVREQCEVDDIPALFSTIDGVEKWTIIGDSASPQIISFLNRQGFKVLRAIKGPGSVEAGVEFLKSYDIVVHPRCETLIDEFRRFSFKVDPRTKLVIPELDWKTFHPNAIPALMYGIEPVRRGIGVQRTQANATPPAASLSRFAVGRR